MDKVQAAIAKARAAREQALGLSSGPSGRAGPRSGALGTNRTVLSGASDRATIWQPLATFAPSARSMAKQRIVSFDADKQERGGVFAFAMLRTKVLQQMRANGWKRLAITSPGPGCGKTTVAMNLAFSLARQPETYAIVAEMDMRRPSMAKTMGLNGEINFASVIEGKADFADIAMRPRPNLAFGLNYSRTRNPSELLQSSTVGRVLADIEKRFAPDMTIFDMPPMLQSDDTMAFMGQVDCVLLVAGAESTSLREIDICERDLATQTNVMGVLLNKCRYMDKDTGAAGTYE